MFPLTGAMGDELIPEYTLIIAPGTPVPESALFGLQAITLLILLVHTDPTGTGLQSTADSDSPGAVADAVMMSPSTKPETPVIVQFPELTVVVPNNPLFLKTLIVVPFPSDEVPEMLVDDEVIVLVIDVQADLSAGKPPSMPVTGVG